MHNHAAQSSVTFQGYIHLSFTNSQCWGKIEKKNPVQSAEGGGERKQQLPIYCSCKKKKIQSVKANQLQNNIKCEQNGIKIPFVFLIHYFVVK